MIRILLILSQAFNVWMLYDAYQRRAKTYWYFVMFLPFGEWLYFFKVKIHDPEIQALKDKLFPYRPPALDAVRQLVKDTPSENNRMLLGQALHDADKFGEGAEVFGSLLRNDGENLEARFGLAACRVGLGEWEAAADAYAQVVDKEPGYKDYWASLHLIDAYWESGRRAEALAHGKHLARTTPRINHSVTYAHYLAESGQVAEARRIVEAALEEYQTAPRFTRDRDRQWARRAESVLKDLKRRDVPAADCAGA